MRSGPARVRVGVLERFGLVPVAKAVREARLAVRGDPLTPKTRFDASSLRMLDPRLSLPIWLGRTRADRRVAILNLFNRTPTPADEGWSVRITQVRDFRGGRLTYDSHNGTDFCVPVGTIVVAAAPGRVLRVSSEFHRGGLKVFVDHGRGLVTSSNHLARALVREGAVVRRGQPIALAGASGLDLVTFFPWLCPHVHWNVFLDGVHVDPFAAPGEVSLFRGGEPRPDDGRGRDAELEEAGWDPSGVERAIEACLDAPTRAEIAAIADPDRRAMAALFHTAYFPTRFRERPRLYREAHARRPWLDLPFRAEDFVGIALPE